MTQPDGDINDLLTDRERILMVAWALPTDGALSPTQRKQAMDNFGSYIRRHRMKPTDVARRIGKPKATTIGDLLRGVYRAKTDDHIRKLNMFIEQHARARVASLADQFVATTKVAKDMLTVARLVRENRTMGIVYGPSGVGKSRCAAAIGEKYVGSICISIMWSYHHAKGLTQALAHKLGVRKRLSQTEGDHLTQIERVIEGLRDSADC